MSENVFLLKETDFCYFPSRSSTINQDCTYTDPVVSWYVSRSITTRHGCFSMLSIPHRAGCYWAFGIKQHDLVIDNGLNGFDSWHEIMVCSSGTPVMRYSFFLIVLFPEWGNSELFPIDQFPNWFIKCKGTKNEKHLEKFNLTQQN